LDYAQDEVAVNKAKALNAQAASAPLETKNTLIAKINMVLRWLF
jgi:hypothetical protein